MLSTLTILTGCSSEPSRYSVSGTVNINGAPGALVVVRFVPETEGAGMGGSGYTDQAGKFTIGGTGPNSGMPGGNYKVTFSQTLVGGKPTLAGSGGKKEELQPTEKEALPEDYRNPAKTPFSAKVGSGDNNFTFDIKTK